MIEVSIVTPLYNCQNYISRTINSVINQDFQNWEMIIVDDISTDSGPDIVNEFVLKDSRIKYYKLEEKGFQAGARNKAIQLASGRFIAFLDSDDIWYERKLSIQIDFMKRYNLSLTHTSYDYIDENDTIISFPLIVNDRVKYSSLFFRQEMSCLSVIYDSHKLGKNFMKHLKKKQDFLLWLDLLKITDYSYGIKEVTCAYRQRKDSVTSRKLPLLLNYIVFLRSNTELNHLQILYYTIIYSFRGLFRYKLKPLLFNFYKLIFKQ